MIVRDDIEKAPFCRSQWRACRKDDDGAFGVTDLGQRGVVVVSED